MSDFTENIVTGKKYRICTNKDTNTWDRVSMWTSASDVEMEDGTTAETAIGTLNSNLTANSTPLVFDYQDGQYGYNTSTERGADTFHPFKGYQSGTIEITSRSTIEVNFESPFNEIPKIYFYRSNTIASYPYTAIIFNNDSYLDITKDGFKIYGGCLISVNGSGSAFINPSSTNPIMLEWVAIQ